MTTRTTFSVLVILLFCSVAVLGATLPQVLQPNEATHSATELAILTQGINTLKGILSDTDLASRHLFSGNDWRSLNFAQYTAGRLAELGYATQIVHQAGWPDGVHAWVLAAIPLASGTVWVPVEASPEPNKIQQNLGFIPSHVDGAGNLVFDARYTSFSEVVNLPPNLPPVANIRSTGTVFEVGQTIKLMALGAYDPGGEIVLYQWNFGNGKTAVFTSAVARYTYTRVGDYVVTLTVIDSGGKSATASLTLQVGTVEVQPREPEKACGC